MGTDTIYYVRMGWASNILGEFRDLLTGVGESIEDCTNKGPHVCEVLTTMNLFELLTTGIVNALEWVLFQADAHDGAVANAHRENIYENVHVLTQNIEIVADVIDETHLNTDNIIETLDEFRDDAKTNFELMEENQEGMEQLQLNLFNLRSIFHVAQQKMDDDDDNVQVPIIQSADHAQDALNALLNIFPSGNGTGCRRDDDDDNDIENGGDGDDDDDDFELQYCDFLTIVNSPNSIQTKDLIEKIKSGQYGDDSDDDGDGDDGKEGDNDSNISDVTAIAPFS